jgi:hypothetical protein
MSGLFRNATNNARADNVVKGAMRNGPQSLAVDVTDPPGPVRAHRL